MVCLSLCCCRCCCCEACCCARPSKPAARLSAGTAAHRTVLPHHARACLGQVLLCKTGIHPGRELAVPGRTVLGGLSIALGGQQQQSAPSWQLCSLDCLSTQFSCSACMPLQAHVFAVCVLLQLCLAALAVFSCRWFKEHLLLVSTWASFSGECAPHGHFGLWITVTGPDTNNTITVRVLWQTQKGMHANH